jgi:cell division protein FtsI (penicillin-binding protein 3)
MTLKKEILIRVGVVYIACLLFALLILGRVIQIQVVQGGKWQEKAQELTLKDITITPERGNILDQHGRLLASSIPYYDIHMDMKSPALTDKIFYAQVDSLSLCLSKLFKNKSKEAYKNELIKARRKGHRYYPIKRHVNYLQMKACQQFPIFRLGRYGSGVIYTQQNIRVNPHDPLAQRTLGYLNRGASGNVVGIEGAYDHYLKGVEGVRLMQKLSGNIWMPVNNNNEIEPVDGKDVVTTIDVNLQDVAHSALKDQLEMFNAEYGCVVLMEVQTGEVKAIVNLKRTSNGWYTEEFNYAIGTSSEPGSTFKLASLMAALEDRLIDITDTVDLKNGVTYYYNKKVEDSERHNYRWVTIKRAFEISSNVGISSVIHTHYKSNERAFIDRIYQMGLNNNLGIEIKGEARPYIKYPGEQHWSGVSLPQISHGYEIRLTPLQILAFYNAVANEGKLVKPMFVKEIRYHGKVVKRFHPEVINHSICSKYTIKKARELLEAVVEDGTANKLKNTPFKIAGKTGTAKLYDKEKGTYVSEYEASFAGYFPADNPKYSCIVVIHKPKDKGFHGSEAAAPVFSEIAHKVYASEMANWNDVAKHENTQPAYTKSGSLNELEYALKSLGIPLVAGEKGPWVVTTCLGDKVKVQERAMINGLVPNVLQMGAKDALYLLENAGLQVKIVGRGTVMQQSVPPGTRIVKNDVIELKMSII